MAMMMGMQGIVADENHKNEGSCSDGLGIGCHKNLCLDDYECFNNSTNKWLCNKGY
jgi:hypothetical protein